MKIKRNNFIEAFNLIKSNPKEIFKIIIFDILFLISVKVLYELIELLMPKNITEISPGNGIMLLIMILLYYIAFLLVYSLCKRMVLKIIRQLFNKKVIKKFGTAKSFFFLNLVIYVMFFLIFILINSLVVLSAKQEMQSIVFLIINIPLFLLFYYFVNFSHTSFAQSEKIRLSSNLKESFRLLGKFKEYAKLFLINLGAVIAYAIIYFLIGSLFKITLFSSRTMVAKYNNIYVASFVIITTLFFYLILLFNRIYFFKIVKNVST